jgi:hypothetical protein
MTQPTFVGAALATPNFSTTISHALTGVSSGNTLIAAYSVNPQVLSAFVITGTGGQCSCAAATLVVGDVVNIAGTFGGTGSITGYVNPTNYKISVTNGSTTFTLQTLAGGAIVSVAGTPTGLTIAVSGAPTISDPDGAYTIFFGPNFSTGSTFAAWSLGWRQATSTGSHTITASNASTQNETQNLIVMAYSGGLLDSAGASVNGTFSASGTGANIGGSGNITPSQSSTTIIGIGFAVQSLNTILVGTSPIAFTSRFNTTAYWMIEDFVQGSAAPIAANFGLSGGNANDTIQAMVFALDTYNVVAPVPPSGPMPKQIYIMP